MENPVVWVVLVLIAIPCYFGIKKIGRTLFKGSCGCDGGEGCTCREHEHDDKSGKGSCCCGKEH